MFLGRWMYYSVQIVNTDMRPWPYVANPKDIDLY